MKRTVFQYLISVFIIKIALCSEECAPRVTTHLGKVKGFYNVSYNGRNYEAYEGIPFAKPPTGELRFQPPQPINTYDHEIDATKEPSICPQYDLGKKIIIGNEDCLYLNVYTPRHHGTALLPVIFYIYGGAYQWGAGTDTRAKYIMDRDVVLVTFNYRIGPFGFLSTGDDVISGNMGLKDQNLALRWVNNNIQYFGGDPKRITLMGNSAGGVSVHLHYMSPLSSGLFQNGVSSSGTALGFGAYDKDGSAPMKKFAEVTNCPSKNSQQLLNCLKSKSFAELSTSYAKLMASQQNIFGINGTSFKPVIEKTSKDYFINRAPIEYLENGKIYDAPWTAGVVSEEGLYFVGGYTSNNTAMTYIDENWGSLAPYVLGYADEIPNEKYADIANKAKKHYLGDKPISKESLRDFARLLGDRIILAHAEKAVKLQAKANQSPVRFYYYSYKAAQGICDYFLGAANNFGVCHTDDVNFVLENKFTSPVSTKEDRAMLADVLDLWYSIASVKESSLVSWVKVNYSSELLNYLHIAGPKNFTSRSTDNFADKKFWKSIGIEP